MKPKFTGTEKQCRACKNTFPIEDFYMAKQTKIYSSRCKKCDLKYHTERFNSSYKKRATVLVNSARHNQKGIPISITVQDVISQYEQQNGKCYYSGRPLSCISGDRNVMSIDRKDSNSGYTTDNIVICCWKVNMMKNTLSKQDFLELCKDVVTFSSSQTI